MNFAPANQRLVMTTAVGTGLAVLITLSFLLLASGMAEAQEPPTNNSATGAPTISGTAQVRETTPAISSIAITGDTGDEDSSWDDDGIYGIGDRIEVTVTFSADVTVTGSPRLELDIGGTARPAEYERAEGSKVVFGYTVIEGDADNDGIAISENRLTLNGGSIKDAADNAADLPHDALAAQNDRRVDGIRPTISRVDLHGNDGTDFVYLLGEVVSATTLFSEEIIIEGAPQLALDMNGVPRAAPLEYVISKCEPSEPSDGAFVFNLCVSEGESSNPRGIILGFAYTVTRGDEDSDGLGIGTNAISLNGGTIRDAAGNDADLTYVALLDNAPHIVDGVPPEVTSVAITSDPGDDDTYGVGDVLEITVTFSEAAWLRAGMTPNHVPRIKFDIGGEDRMAGYSRLRSSMGGDSSDVVFAYTVQDGDNDVNGIAIGSNALQLVGARLYDKARRLPGPANNADIDHKGLADNAEHKVATTAVEMDDDEQSPPKSGLLTIKGTVRVGETLTADTSGLTDEDGLDFATLTYTYFWVTHADGVSQEVMNGASPYPSPTYIIKASDEGKAISVRVLFYDDNGNAEVRDSAPTEPVKSASALNFPPTGLPTISGTLQVGQTLTADVTGIADADGLDNATFTYQWVRGNRDAYTNIQDAPGSSYTLVSEDEGKTIMVMVSFTDNAGNVEALTSDPTEEVVPEAGPLTGFTVVNTSSDPDTVLGRLEDGGTLTLDNPASDSHGIRVDTDSNDDIHKVELELDGEKDAGKEEWESPYSLYGDDGEGNLTGESLPAGAYDLKATAFKKNGDVLGTLKVSFTVTAGQPAQQPTVVPNNSATGAPTVSGTAQVGQTLTADTSGIADADGLTNAVFSYQWVRNDGSAETNIQGATDATYTLTEDDEGKAITVTVSFTDDANNEESLTSEPTGPEVPDPGQLTEFTVVDTSSDPDGELGALEDGGTLTLDNPAGGAYGIRVDTNSNDDIHKVALALSGAKTANKDEWVFPYSLYGDDGEGNLTGESLPAGAYDLKATAFKKNGDVLGTLKVSFTVTAGQPAQQPTVVPNTSATGAPTIGGTAQVGQTLTADTSGIADEDGLTNAVFSYQWMADDANIQGATGSSYTLTGDDKGKTITVTVSFTDAEGNPETLTSDPTGEVAAKPNTSATGVPTITGTVQVGQTLMADTSEIADEDGLTNAVFSYQWIADDANIQGATGSSYTLTEDDKGKAITVTVSFTDAEGNPETLTSDPTGEVTAAPAQNTQATGAPSISGTAQVGSTLTADTTGIADTDGLTGVSYSYQWRADDANVQGATDATYTLAEDDEGKAIKVLVSFTDDAGNMESLPSAPTDAVATAPAQNTLATGAPTITGTVQVGETLRADTSGIADEDGLTNAVFSYQWMADDANIQGATDRTYALAEEEEGKAIKVRVSFTDDAHNEESLPSAATDAVAALTVPGKPLVLAGEATAQEIKLTWTAPTDDTVVEYVVYRGTLQNGSMNGQALSKYATIDATGKAMTYTDDNVEEGVEYRYRVAAVNSAGEGKKSTWLDITAE